MLAKILILVLAVSAGSCEERHYRVKSVIQQDGLKEYGHHPYHQYLLKAPQVTEPSSEEQYKLPEHHGNTYSSQSVIHHGQAAAYEESHESNDHAAPVYQYVNEHNEVTAHHAAPIKHKYQAVHYPAHVQHEVHPVHVPHHKTEAYYQHQPESHEDQKYHHEIPHNAPQLAVSHQVPIHHQGAESHEEPIDYYAYPKYQFEYKVEDPHTGDNKFQHEYRDGDVVKGVYGLHEADGSLRTVEYSSDKHSGFTAIVKHSAPGHHVQIESHHQN